MIKETIIKIEQEETFTAVLEDGDLVEIYFEREGSQNIVGNIYKGKVENVLPGMQAAFVNIGLERNGFLYVNDAVPREMDANGSILETSQKIEDVLRKGQELLVQVVKEPVGNKGARITTHITVPGRYGVLMPTVDYIGISRRIENEEERLRLRELAHSLLENKMGMIVRTAALGVDMQELASEIKYLVKQWKRLQGKTAAAIAPQLIHSDMDLQQRMVRDILTADMQRVIVNSAEAKEQVYDLIGSLVPSLQNKIEICTTDICDTFDLNSQLQKALRRKVWLNCGGYLIIDQMEAMTVVDVNTGKFVGDNNLAETVLQTNVEAAMELAKQLRLRNIGGIVIIDFIDMKSEDDRTAVVDVLTEELKRDRIKTNVLEFTQLGLLEMTRKKNGHQLSDVLLTDCSFCGGRGKIFAAETLYQKIKSDIYQTATQSPAPAIYVEASPTVAAFLIGPGGRLLEQMEQEIGKKLYIKGMDGRETDEVLIRGMYENDAEQCAAPVTVGQILDVKICEKHLSNGEDGVAKISGFIIAVPQAGRFVGQTVRICIDKVGRTFASGILQNRE